MSKLNSPIPYLKLKDHSVSLEEFELHLDEQLGILETFPKPSLEKLPEYYKSEDYISHTDSRRNFFEFLYQSVKKIALKKKVRLINQFSPNGTSLLDMGCGTGDFLRTASDSGWKIVGIEPDLKARQIANSKTSNSVYDADQLKKLETGSFDVITLWHVLEHLPDYLQSLEQLTTLLKPKGILVIAVPNYKSYDALHYKQFWAAFDVPRHLWHFSQYSFQMVSQKLGLEIVEKLPLKLDSYYVSLLSEKYKTGKMNFFKSFMTGWRSNHNARFTGEYSSLIYVLKQKRN